MAKLLTIAVPTYNRARHLELLLRTLAAELAGLEDSVDVIVSDNASTDDTPSVTAEFAAAYGAARILRQPSNVGPENNFCECIERCQTRYFWIIGDDDVPRRGALRPLLQLLDSQSPDLVHLETAWVPHIEGPDQIGPLAALHYEHVEQLAFARRVHIHFTFISGIIVNLAAFRALREPVSVRRHVGSSLVQLGWVLALLAQGQRFIHVHDRCMLATEGNTGGYAAFTVFGANFPRIVGEMTGRGSTLAQVLVGRHLACYLPSLMWHVRFSHKGRFASEDAWAAMRAQIGHHPLYWLYVIPVGRLPRRLAWPVYALSRLLARAIARADLRRSAGPIATLEPAAT